MEHLQQNVALVDDADHLAVAVEHRELRDVVQLHAAVGDQEVVVRADGDRAALFMAAADEVAQVALAVALDEALVDHPVVVEHLAEVLVAAVRSEEHTSELQSLMRISYAVFCLKKK